MTRQSAPTATPLSPIEAASSVAFTQDEVRVVLARREHDRLHDEWKRHERACDRCVFGYRCRIADAYAIAADDAGKQVDLVKAKAARMAGAGA